MAKLAKKKIKMPELPIQEKKKHIIKSKTAWVNSLIPIIIAFLPPDIKAKASEPEVLSSIFVLINILLRLISKDKVHLI